MLTGYRVLDVTQFVAGPTCTRILAELGAEVIKVEIAPHGDRGRASGDKPRDAGLRASSQSTYYFQHNHSKKSLAVDIKQDRGRALVHALIPKIDVVVENFAPGVMARAGLGYEELSRINPRLIKPGATRYRKRQTKSQIRCLAAISIAPRRSVPCWWQKNEPSQPSCGARKP